MVKMKAGGIVLGGLAAYLILSKGIGAMERGIRNICVARQWKNYYKYGKDGNMVPPGYASHTRQVNENEEQVMESPEEIEAKRKQAQDNASNKGTGAAIADVIVKAISDVFDGIKGGKRASEGQTEPCESAEKGTDETKPVCPENCDICDVKNCPHAHLKNGGKILEWDESGRPVAGRYPWDKEGKEFLNWKVSTDQETPIVKLNIDYKELNDPLYVESLENGVELEEGDTDGDSIFVDKEGTET